MSATYVAVLGVTAAINMGIAIADFQRAPFVLQNSAEVGVPARHIVTLGALKAAGALGLLMGIAGFIAIGRLAAAGLLVFFACALALHVQKRVLHNIAFPGTFFAFALMSLLVPS